MSREYDMRCPECGGDRIYAPASCFVEVSRLDDEGNLRVFPDSVIRVEPNFDGELHCGTCAARFWEAKMKFEVGGVSETPRPRP